MVAAERRCHDRLGGARRLGYNNALWVDDEARARQHRFGWLAVGSDEVASGYIDPVLEGTRAQDRCPHVEALYLREWCDHEFHALDHQRPGRLGDVVVVADQDADTPVK